MTDYSGCPRLPPIQQICACTHHLELLPNDGGGPGYGKRACEEKPQSAPAITFSRPTSLAKRRSRSAISSGCSTILLAWVMTVWNEHLAFRDLDALEELVLVLAPRIGGLEAEPPGVDLDYVVDDLRQAYLVEPRPLVDALARVEAHPLPAPTESLESRR